MYDVPGYGDYGLAQKPRAIHFLIFLNIVGFILSGIIPYFLAIRGYEEIMPLTKETTIEKLWLWQFFSFGFIYNVKDWAIFGLIIFMYMLYLFGKELELVVGSKKLIIIYFGCQAIGGYCYVVYQYLSCTSVPAVGNQFPGAMALICTSAFMWPSRPIFFFFLIPMRMITACLIVIGVQIFFSLIDWRRGGVPIASLGAIAASFVWFKTGPVFDSLVARMENASVRRKYLMEERLRKEVDRILEKISKQGRSSITKKEEETLKKASKLFARRQ